MVVLSNLTLRSASESVHVVKLMSTVLPKRRSFDLVSPFFSSGVVMLDVFKSC